MSKAITEKPESPAPQGEWQTLRETAPSAMRVDEPSFGRVIGFVGLMFLALGGTALLLHAANWTRGIGPLWGSLAVIAGLACLLFHALCDSEEQVRRIYGLVGFLWLAVGVVVSLLPVGGPVGTLFLPYGWACLLMGLFFLFPFIRHETDLRWRGAALSTLGGGGAILGLLGLGGGIISESFLAPYGLALAILGLLYLGVYLGMQGPDTDRGYRVGLLIGMVGALVFLIALGRTLLPSVFHSFGWMSARPAPYFVPSGLLLMTTSLLYVLLAVGVTSDSRLVTLTRRELSAYFFSPIAYIVLFGVTLIGWFMYWRFISRLWLFSQLGEPLLEPIVSGYILDWIPVLIVLIAVPILTMRLLSEERRTGSLEVLMTAPLDEYSVVLSKFLAVLAFYTLLWVPWGLLLLGLRMEMGQPFEYRTLLTFLIVMLCTGAGFLSMGLFFSALTRNQVIAAVLTFAMILVNLMAFLARGQFQSQPGQPESVWITILTHVSVIDLWISSIDGQLAPQFLIYHLSVAVFGLFLTIKVLEARKWL